MAERRCSKDGRRATEEIIGGAEDIAQSGRQSGDIEWPRRHPRQGGQVKD